MTEQAKQDALAWHKELLRQNQSRFDTTDWQKAFEEAMRRIDKDPLIAAHQLQLANEIADVIAIWDEKLNRIRRVITYIEQTDASDISMDSLIEQAKL